MALRHNQGERHAWAGSKRQNAGGDVSSGGPTEPTNVTPPAIVEGSLAIGDSPTWTHGTWSVAPTSYINELYADGVVIAGGPYASGGYELTAAEADKDIIVGERAVTFAPSEEAFSASVGPVVDPDDITAPVLTLTSGSDNPPVVTREIVDESAGEGDLVQRRIDTVDTYNSGDELFEERVLLWDGTDFVVADPVTFEPSPFTIQTGLNTGTLYYLSERFRRDLGDSDLYSAWSNDVTFTMSAPASETPTVLAHVNGGSVNNATYVSGTSSGSTDTELHGPGGGFNDAPCSARASQARTGKRQFQVTHTSAPESPKLWIGLDDGSTAFNSGFPIPGKSNSAGIAFKLFGDGGYEIWHGASMVQSHDGTGIADMVTGEIITLNVDTSTGTVKLYRKISGVHTQVGATVTGLSLSSWRPFLSSEGSHVLTAKFDTGQDRTLDATYTPWDN